jgi:AraC family transcriptional regulator of adaptative response / DNA-3-methyladenine glycosylase II
VFLPQDTGIRDALRGLGRDPADSSRLAAAWSPWRSYAQLYLWHTLGPKEN